MKSLVHLCHDTHIPQKQKEFFCKFVIENLATDAPSFDIATRCLSNLWERYDSGGMSAGRSLRAALLEEVISSLREGCIDSRVKLILSILLGMYHDASYINAQEWYDYHIEYFFESDVLHRVWLSVAAFCLDIDDVVEMSDWPIERIKVLVLQES